MPKTNHISIKPPRNFFGRWSSKEILKKDSLTHRKAKKLTRRYFRYIYARKRLEERVVFDLKTNGCMYLLAHPAFSCKRGCGKYWQLCECKNGCIGCGYGYDHPQHSKFRCEKCHPPNEHDLYLSYESGVYSANDSDFSDDHYWEMREERFIEDVHNEQTTHDE